MDINDKILVTPHNPAIVHLYLTGQITINEMWDKIKNIK